MSTTSPTRSQEPSSPGFPPIPHGNLSAKGLDTTNTTYPVSFVRTPLPLLPFPHPKWHIQPSTGEIYEVTSPILEEYDPVTGYIGSVGAVRESIERPDEGFREGSDRKVEDGSPQGWNGYVRHPESHERSSIQLEAKRIREEREGYVNVETSKRQGVGNEDVQ
ncbi:hypothetical protein BU26DRAFT_516847 [Trematosphaeria pertusa]|uniref:Uncharacterized protein n=1 Tax=Trematosphaeria pertusa TaxID=390896 RepID=A0A6A6INL3_9PLEO|nr:uncharacterized protein BU26DRAFT_516847 [Trematosphaeria pertusa]KAF2252154.1 hypothetical protein BU26DRAFT_516847 [Trematosphaeria pertusa]